MYETLIQLTAIGLSCSLPLFVFYLLVQFHR